MIVSRRKTSNKKIPQCSIGYCPAYSVRIEGSGVAREAKVIPELPEVSLQAVKYRPGKTIIQPDTIVGVFIVGFLRL